MKKLIILSFISVVFLVSCAESKAVVDAGKHPLLFVLFETVSAYATVGLSAGITLDWNIAGKLILVATMFVGRVGILTFMLSLMEQDTDLIKYPSENVMIG